MNRCKKTVIYLLLGLMLLALATPAALADEVGEIVENPVDITRENNLTIEYEYDETPIPGARFDVYHVADLSEELVLTLTEPFAETGLDLNGMDARQLQEAAEDMAKFVENSEVPVVDHVVTNQKGLAMVHDLKAGAYLVVGYPTTMDDRIHYSSPQLVILPMQDGATGAWNYAVTIELKSISHHVDEKLLDLTVIKKWADEGYEESRPVSVTVHLLWNDEIYDTVVLSEANNWTHTWYELLPIGSWRVQEEVPAGYVVEISNDGTTFTLLNSKKDIPQTGQLWWPVPVLMAGGLALILVGVLTKRGSRYED